MRAPFRGWPSQIKPPHIKAVEDAAKKKVAAAKKAPASAPAPAPAPAPASTPAPASAPAPASKARRLMSAVLAPAPAPVHPAEAKKAMDKALDNAKDKAEKKAEQERLLRPPQNTTVLPKAEEFVG